MLALLSVSKKDAIPRVAPPWRYPPPMRCSQHRRFAHACPYAYRLMTVVGDQRYAQMSPCLTQPPEQKRWPLMEAQPQHAAAA